MSERIRVVPPFASTGLVDELHRPIFADGLGVRFVFPERFTLASLVTLFGYACSLAFIAGAPWYVGALGILADEADGRIARARGETTLLGKELDYAADVTLTGLSALKLMGPAGLAALPLVTLVQADLRSRGERPRYGSARAVMMAAKMVLP